MGKRTRAALIIVAGAVLVGAAIGVYSFRQPRLQLAAIVASYDPTRPPPPAKIVYPFSGSVFPPEISGPTVRWQDDDSQADAWVVRFEFSDGATPLDFESESREWTPSEADWTTIKERSRCGPAKLIVLGVRRAKQDTILSAGKIEMRTSDDPVAAPIFYREVNLPFLDAVKDPSTIRWRFGAISATQQPPIVLEKLPVCGNCHSFSKDGATLGMDVDYANDKGSYAILPIAPHILLNREKIITWNDYRRSEREPTFGLLSAVSPDGRYAISTVKDESVFVPRDDIAYSQLFFPIKGILAVYDRSTRKFSSLPGADDPKLVQSNPTWSPDGKYIVFARSKVYEFPGRGESRARNTVLLSQEDCEDVLIRGKTFLFDLYRLPFNEGRGGKAEPLAAASQNGKSNYFAKYSPDGRWIVFCRAKSFMLLQPDSELWIMPADGKEARRMACNLPGMNSWHSWSPNGRWLVFSSKVFTPYTQLFLTHVDEHGESAPPVLLSRFTAPDRAANIPEFVNAEPNAIKLIEEKFLNDYNYARMARENLLSEDLDRAETASRQALALNPDSADALCNLGVVMGRRGRFDEAIDLFSRSLKLDPNNSELRVNLGNALTSRNRWEDSLGEYREALRLDPKLFAARVLLGRNLLRLGRCNEAIEQLVMAVNLRPTDVAAEADLGMAYQHAGKLSEAAARYTRILKRQPDCVAALTGLAMVRATAKAPDLRNASEAISLAHRACEVTKFEDAEALAMLAKVYGEAGRYSDAVRAGRLALDIAQRAENIDLARAMQRAIQQYQVMAAGN